MIDDSSYLRLKRSFREKGEIDGEFFVLLRRLVFTLAFQRALPPAYSPTGRWDEDAAEEALAGWASRRLVGTKALAQAFDHASAARPFILSLERNFRHYLQNERERGEIDNLLDRTARLLGDDKRFRAWVPRRNPGETWWGLALEVEPPPFAASDDELVSIAWGIGDVVLWRYSSSVERASPVLSTDELGRFVEEVFRRVGALLTLNHLAVVFRRRFDLNEPDISSLGEVHDDLPDDEPPVRDEGAQRRAATAVLAQLTRRQTDAVYRKWKGASLEAIAGELGISRGTVDNELRRAGETIKRHTADFSSEELEGMLEMLLDALS